METPLDRMMDFDLTPEQRQIRAAVSGFAEKEIQPFVEQYEREARYPTGPDPEARPSGLHRADDSRGVRRLLRGRDDLRDHLRGAGEDRLGGRLGRLRHQFSAGRIDLAFRLRRAEAALASGHGRRQLPHLGVSDRARRGNRPRQPAHPGGEGGRRLASQRDEGLHLPRRPRGALPGGGDRRSGEEAQGSDRLSRRPATARESASATSRCAPSGATTWRRSTSRTHSFPTRGCSVSPGKGFPVLGPPSTPGASRWRRAASARPSAASTWPFPIPSIGRPSDRRSPSSR